MQNSHGMHHHIGFKVNAISLRGIVQSKVHGKLLEFANMPFNNNSKAPHFNIGCI